MIHHKSNKKNAYFIAEIGVTRAYIVIIIAYVWLR
jgi:uncharacterized membrane protein